MFFLALVTVGPLVIGITHTPRASAQSTGQLHETLFAPGPAFNVGRVIYPSAHDFDITSGTDTCLSLSVPPGDTFTLSLEWEALFGGPQDAGDLDLYLYLDSACTESALLTSSFNSNAYTGELAEITPQVRNIGSASAVAGVRIGKRSGKGTPGQLSLRVLTGQATFLEHGTTGPPLAGQEGAPEFLVKGPFSIPENSAVGTVVGTVTAMDAQSDAFTFFELEPAAGQTSFQIDPVTGRITVEDPSLLDRESTGTVVYWIGVTDGVAASLAGIGINLRGVNDNTPVAIPRKVVTGMDTPVAISLSGTDADIDPAQVLTMNIVSQPMSGSVGAPVAQGTRGATVVYTPPPGFTGTDSFRFTVTDGLTTSAPATVNITVTNDPTLLPTPTPVPGPGTPTAATATPAPTPTGAPVSNPAPTAPGTATPTSTPSTPSGPGSTPPPTATGNTVPSPTPTVAAGSTPTGSPASPPVFIPPPTSGAPVEQVVPPSAPRFLRAEARNSSALLTWQRPLSNGGAAIDGYRIFNINTARSVLVLGDVLEGRVTGLQNGTSYLFQVRAFNSVGFGEGALVGPVTPSSGSPAPLDARASVHPDDTVTVWWSPPDGEQLKPVAAYRLWTEDGELLATVAPAVPLIVNLEKLEGDAYHSFRVTASDADGELVATGVTEPVYLPSTIASHYEPMPPSGITVELTESARSELQIALRDAAGGAGTVMDAPAVLTIRDGQAALFIRTEGLHRGLTLPPGFTVVSDQLMIEPTADGELSLQVEIASNTWLSGRLNELIDPSGILFRPTSTRLLVIDTPDGADPLRRFEVSVQPRSLSRAFLVEARTPEDVPLSVSDALADPLIRSLAGLTEVTKTGLEVRASSAEQVRLGVNGAWYENKLAEGNNLLLFRIDAGGVMEASEVACVTPDDSETFVCSGEFESGASERSFYTLAAVSDFQRPQPTPQVTSQPTVVSAPTEPEPTATAGPALVVVKEPTPYAVAAPTVNVIPQPTPTSTPAEPVLPGTEGGLGGATVVTWLMSGVLGLVVIRGAFYAVGRIRP